MKVKLNLDNPLAEGYSDLTPGNVYKVVGIEADDFRIVNDEGDPYLYPYSIFIVVDPTERSEWITKYGKEGERYSYPEELGTPGFFEDFFNGSPKARATFKSYMQRLCRNA